MLVQPSLTEDWVVSAKVVTLAKADLATVQFAINLMNQDVPSSVINGTVRITINDSAALQAFQGN